MVESDAPSDAAATVSSTRFTVPYKFEVIVRSSGPNCQPNRMKRLAQEVTTCKTSLPLTDGSSIFVRYDTDRIDIMKVLITGPSDTPYSNGCFEFDVYFPPEYPKMPMQVSLIIFTVCCPDFTFSSFIILTDSFYYDGSLHGALQPKLVQRWQSVLVCFEHLAWSCRGAMESSDVESASSSSFYPVSHPRSGALLQRTRI